MIGRHCTLICHCFITIYVVRFLCQSSIHTEEWAISAMTGGNAWRYERTASEKSWERMDLVTQKSDDKRACAFRHNDA